MSSINWLAVEGQVAQELAMEFEDPIQAKIETLTAEEMFYLLRLLQYEPRYRKPDVLLAVLQTRAKDWLRGKRRTCGLPFEFLKKFWQQEFFEFVRDAI